MDIQTAIAILETKKLTCCNQKEFIQAADMAIAALRQQVPKLMNVSFQNNTNAASPQGIRVFSPKIKANVRVE